MTENDTEAVSVKVDELNEEKADAKVPCLLDLNPFDMKDTVEDDASSQNTHDTSNGGDSHTIKEESDTSEIPFKLKKNHLYTAFRMHYSLNSVILKPFRADFFTNPTVQLWVKEAKEFCMRQAWNGTSIGMLLFVTYRDAHEALNDLRRALGTENTEIEIRHSHNKPEMPYGYPHEEVEFLLKDRSDQPLISRVMVLEGLPENTNEEELVDFFPDARTVIILTHGEEMKGYGLVEFPAPHKLRDALNDYKKDGEGVGSAIEVKGIEVQLTKFMSRYNQATYWLRSHPPEAEPKLELQDEERLETCRNLKDYMAERDKLLNGTDPDGSVEDTVELYWTLIEKMQSLVKHLNYDTSHRRMVGKPFPEPKDLRINPVAILGYPEEEDEEITAASGKIPSLMDMNFFSSQPQGAGSNSIRRKRSGTSTGGGPVPKKEATGADFSDEWEMSSEASSQMMETEGSLKNEPMPLMDVSSTSDVLTRCMYSVSSGKGNMPSNVQSLASTIQKATELLHYAGSNPKNVFDDPLENVRWCKVPLPCKKPLASRNSEVVERLYLVAYPKKFDDRILQNVLCRFGDLIDAYFSKGSNYGYAKFANKKSAQNAVLIMNNQVVEGSTLMVRKADVPGERGSRRYSRE